MSTLNETTRAAAAKVIIEHKLCDDRAEALQFVDQMDARISQAAAAFRDEADGPTRATAHAALCSIAAALEQIADAADRLGYDGTEAVLSQIPARPVDKMPIHDRALYLLALVDDGDTLITELHAAAAKVKDAAEAARPAGRGPGHSPANAAKKRHADSIVFMVLDAAESRFGREASQKRGGWADDLLAPVLAGLQMPMNCERAIRGYQERKRRQRGLLEGHAPGLFAWIQRRIAPAGRRRL